MRYVLGRIWICLPGASFHASPSSISKARYAKVSKACLVFATFDGIIALKASQLQERVTFRLNFHCRRSAQGPMNPERPCSLTRHHCLLVRLYRTFRDCFKCQRPEKIPSWPSWPLRSRYKTPFPLSLYDLYISYLPAMSQRSCIFLPCGHSGLQ